LTTTPLGLLSTTVLAPQSQRLVLTAVTHTRDARPTTPQSATFRVRIAQVSAARAAGTLPLAGSVTRPPTPLPISPNAPPLAPLMAPACVRHRRHVAAARKAAALFFLGAATSGTAAAAAVPAAAPTSLPASRQFTVDPLRPELLPYLLPSEIANLPLLRRIFESKTRPGELRAESIDDWACTLTFAWPPGQPVDATAPSGRHKDRAVAVVGDLVCTCFLPYDFRSHTQRDVGCARIQASRAAGGKRKCFPASARVALAGRGDGVRVDALALGDRLAVAAKPGGAVSSSPLIGWSHHDAAAVSRFVVITYTLADGDGSRVNASAAPDQSYHPTSRTLRASRGHYLYTFAGDLVPADDVAVGDSLAAADGSPALVVDLSTALDVGLYNPHPVAGELIVDGLRVSAYTTAVPPPVAHAALTPFRAAAAVGVVDPLGRLWAAATSINRRVQGVEAWLTATGREAARLALARRTSVEL